MSDNIIEFKNVCRSYKMGNRTLDVLKGVDFSLARGEWCCIYGASGSGKTTLLNLAGLLEKPDSGNVIIDGQDTGKFSRHTSAIFRSTEIGFVFQSYHLLPELSIKENVWLAGSIAGMRSRDAALRAEFLLEKVGLKDRLRHRPNELSGGEQQRAAVARALINDPALLLADEPTGNLDFRTGEEILTLFEELRKENLERAILMITHNREIAVRATRTVELKDGKLI